MREAGAHPASTAADGSPRAAADYGLNLYKVMNSSVADNTVGGLFMYRDAADAVESNTVDSAATIQDTHNLNVTKNEGATLLCDSSLLLVV